MKIEVFARRLAIAGLGVEGQTLFCHQMSPECKEGILLKIPLTGVRFDHYLPGYHCRAPLQAIVRAQKGAVGKSLADQVLTNLTIKQRITMNDPDSGEPCMNINQVLPQTQPIRYPRSDGNGLEWSINFEVNYVDLQS